MIQNDYIRKITRLAIYSLVVLFLACSITAHAAPAEFFYDAQGRLVGVKDETGSMAIHRYDAVGNLLSIDTFSPTAGNVGIFLLLPEKGVVGENIDIQGFGFSNVTTLNTVTFNGTPATVVAASFDTLTVTVPIGATTGPVVVTNATGSATSPQPFTISNVPTISGIVPEEVPQGTSNFVVISGSKLTNVTGVTFLSTGLSAILRSGATSESIPLTLQVAITTPPGDYGFSLTTSNGTIQSGLIKIGVRNPVPRITMTNPISVFLPRPPAPTSGSGPALSTASGPSIFFPIPPSPVSPTGPAASSVPGPSVFFPPLSDPVSPSGSSMSIAPPESVLMP